MLRSKDQGVPSMALSFAGTKVHWTFAKTPAHPHPAAPAFASLSMLRSSA